MTRLQRLGRAGFAITRLVFVISSLAMGQSVVVLHNFGSVSGDPIHPTYSGIVAQGRDGNLYTTSPSGGSGTALGTVFKITPSGAVTVLFSFDTVHGGTPYGGLTLGTDGNFYGTAVTSGSGCCGTIFKITPSGTLTVLYNFGGGSDGGAPTAPPIQGTDGNLYGTSNGGVGAPFGTIYKLTPAGKFTTLHAFDMTNGAYPGAPLVQGADGNFYGGAMNGAINGQGVLYRITPSGQFTILFKFDGVKGASPIGPLLLAKDGNFYGTTFGGGGGNVGTVFKMTPSGTVTVIHNFSFSTDGARPNAGLVQGTDGNLYGVAQQGGMLGFGTAYTLSTSGGGYKVLYTFDNTTGAYPNVTPMLHTNGLLYSDTYQGGTGSVSPCLPQSCGVFYSLGAGLGPSVSLVNGGAEVGNTAELLGQGFTGTTGVSFSGTVASFQVVSDTYMTATVPNGALTGTVAVKTPGGTLVSNRIFHVTPQLLSFSPPSGPVGTTVTISGVSLAQTQGVGFGDRVPAHFTVNSDGSVTATVPSGAKTGPIGIQTKGGTAISTSTFTVTP